MKRKLPKRYAPDGSSESGGFGEVIACVDVHLNRRVAIKFLQDPADKDRLRDEIAALLRLRSKHVVQVYDVVRDGEAVGLVEEYVVGDDLWDSEFPRSSPENYLKILWQIASGLADIHDAGVIHRDIKPNNMKLDPEGIVKIYDFGLARQDGPKAKTKGFIGTPGFAAPELCKVGTVSFTTAVDVYAFGATAYFLVHKGLPGELKKVPPDVLPSGAFSTLSVKLPAEISALLEACLHPTPSARPSMRAVANEIGRHLLRDRHQALVVFQRKGTFLNASKRYIKIEFGTIGTVEIEYDGLRYRVRSATGEVRINNEPALAGTEIPGSCVIAIGESHRKAYQRAFITFDISHPEVTI